MATAEDGIAAQIRNIEHTYGKPIDAWIDADLLAWLRDAYRNAD